MIGGLGLIEGYAAFVSKDRILKTIVSIPILIGDIAFVILPRLLGNTPLKTEDKIAIGLSSIEVAAVGLLIWKGFVGKKKNQ